MSKPSAHGRKHMMKACAKASIYLRAAAAASAWCHACATAVVLGSARVLAGPVRGIQTYAERLLPAPSEL